MILNPRLYTPDGRVFNAVYYSSGDVVVGDLICFKRFDLRINNEDVINIRDLVLDYYKKYKYEEGFRFLINKAPAGCITTYTFKPNLVRKILDAIEYNTNEKNPIKIFNKLKENPRTQIKIGDNLGNLILVIQYQAPNNYNNGIENISFHFVEKKLYMNFRLVDFIELYHQLESFSNYFYNIAPYEKENKNTSINKNEIEKIIEDKLSKFKDDLVRAVLYNLPQQSNNINTEENTIEEEKEESDNNNPIVIATKELDNFIDSKINSNTQEQNQQQQEVNNTDFFRINRHTYFDYMTILSIIKSNKLDKKFLYNLPVDIDREQEYYSKKYKEYNFTDLIIAARVLRKHLNEFNTNNILYIFYRYIIETKLAYIIPYTYYLYSLENSNILINYQNKKDLLLSIRNTITTDHFKNYILKYELKDKLNNIQDYILNDYRDTFIKLFNEFLSYLKDVFKDNFHEYIEKGIIDNCLPIKVNIDNTVDFDKDKLFKFLDMDSFDKIIGISKEESNIEFSSLSLMLPSTYYMLLSNNLNVFAARIIEEIINNNKELGDIDPYDLYQQITKSYNKQLNFEQIQYFFNNKDIYTPDILQSLYNTYKQLLEKIISNNLDENNYITKSILDKNNIKYKKIFNHINSLNKQNIQSIYEQFINTYITDDNIKNILLKYKPTSGDNALALFILLYPYINDEFINLYSNLVNYLQQNNIPLTYNPNALLKILTQIKSTLNNLQSEISNKSISKDALQLLLSSDIFKKTGDIYLLNKNMINLLYELSGILTA